MNQQNIHGAAAILWQHWQQSTRYEESPAHCRPGSRAEGYAIQAEVAKLSGQSIVAWKIAASNAGDGVKADFGELGVLEGKFA